MERTLLSSFLLWCLLCCRTAGASAFPGVLFVSDSTDDRVLRLEDIDRSGGIEPSVPGEVSVFYDGSGGGPELSVPSHLVAGAGALYLLDGGTLDSVLILRDGNGDGDATDPGELAVFYDNTGAGPRLGTPNTLLRLPDGSFLLSDDGSAARFILRLKDLNGDGDALDEGETTVVYDGTSQAAVRIEDPESLAWSPDGSLYVGDSTQGAVFRLRDTDGDGTFLGPGEAMLFFQSDIDLPLTDLDSLAVAPDGTLYAGDEDTALILRLRDVDGDGVAGGPEGTEEEVTVFVDSTAAERVRDLNDMQILPDGTLLLVDGAADALFLARDVDGDGDALDAGEVVLLLHDDGETFATPSAAAYQEGPEPRPDADFSRGDANFDGKLDLSDPIAILEFLFLTSGDRSCLDAFDGDDSGAVNITDPIYLLDFLFLGGTAPPPPYPDPGPDPTEDALSCSFDT